MAVAGSLSVFPHAQVINLKAVGGRSRVGSPVIAVRNFVYSNNGQRVYSAREIGERRLAELKLRTKNIRNLVDAEELGTYSIRRIPVLVAFVGLTSNQSWQIVSYTRENIDKYFGHCYVVTGRKIRHIGGKQRTGDMYDIMRDYEHEETGVPANKMCAENMFRECQGRSTHARVTSKVHEGGTVGFVMVTKRFRNSRLTCVMKTRNIM